VPAAHTCPAAQQTAPHSAFPPQSIAHAPSMHWSPDGQGRVPEHRWPTPAGAPSLVPVSAGAIASASVDTASIEETSLAPVSTGAARSTPASSGPAGCEHATTSAAPREHKIERVRSMKCAPSVRSFEREKIEGLSLASSPVPRARLPRLSLGRSVASSAARSAHAAHSTGSFAVVVACDAGARSSMTASPAVTAPRAIPESARCALASSASARRTRSAAPIASAGAAANTATSVC
jgi:hypothetical protein